MSSESDLKLVPGQVVVEAWDLCVDSPDRRKNQTPYRRALVHDFNDGLTINWKGDYPGGVTINGLKTNEVNSLDAKSSFKFIANQVSIKAWDLCLDSPDRRKKQTPQRRALVHDFDDGLTINWANDYPGGVTVNGFKQINGDGNISLNKTEFIKNLTNPHGSLRSSRLEGDYFVYNLLITADKVIYSCKQNGVAVKEMDLLIEITRLREEVDELKQKLENG